MSQARAPRASLAEVERETPPRSDASMLTAASSCPAGYARIVHRALARLLAVAIAASATRPGALEAGPPVPVTVGIVGRGQIRLVVADGASRPCDAADNRMLFNGHVKAGDEMKFASTTGSVCVDHTYGALRESQWAGASIWSGRVTYPGGPEPSIHGTVSTEEP